MNLPSKENCRLGRNIFLFGIVEDHQISYIEDCNEGTKDT